MNVDTVFEFSFGMSTRPNDNNPGGIIVGWTYRNLPLSKDVGNDAILVDKVVSQFFTDYVLPNIPTVAVNAALSSGCDVKFYFGVDDEKGSLFDQKSQIIIKAGSAPGVSVEDRIKEASLQACTKITEDLVRYFA